MGSKWGGRFTTTTTTTKTASVGAEDKILNTAATHADKIYGPHRAMLKTVRVYDHKTDNSSREGGRGGQKAALPVALHRATITHQIK